MIAPVLLAVLTGCMNNPLQAPFTAVIEAPSSVEIGWGESCNGVNDGCGAVIIGDFVVYDSDTDMPLDNIEVEVMSYGGAYLLPAEALQVVDSPYVPEGFSTADCLDEDGNFDNEAYEWCGWVYDSVSGQYYEWGGDYADNADQGEAYNPTYMIGATDRNGLLRVFVYVDALTISGESYSNAQIVGTIGHDDAVFEVGPGGSN